MEYPKFGTVKRCAACGHTYPDLPGLAQIDFTIQFCSAGSVGGKDVSYIRRICPMCGYSWKETPLYLCEDS